MFVSVSLYSEASMKCGGVEQQDSVSNQNVNVPCSNSNILLGQASGPNCITMVLVTDTWVKIDYTQ